ncbi:MAG: OmpA family protein [Terriglobia bacterium]|nr:OmpA family protein [Terriglobia bacterium]
MKPSIGLLLLALCTTAMAQDTTPASSQTTAQTESRTTKAINYRHASTMKVSLQGTDLMPRASGEAKVQSRTGRTEIEIKVSGMDEATKFGLQYLTYVAWALSPQGRAVNLGELMLKNGSSKIHATTDLQTFGMIVTAEPYFAVTQPSNHVVLENVLPANSTASEEEIDFSYQMLSPGAYSSTNTQIKDAIFGIDRSTPLELFEARNAVRIARLANAEKYAGSVLEKAEQSLAQAETSYSQKQNRSLVATYARDAAQTAEDARVMSLKKQEQERLEAESAAREAKARAEAQAEAERRRQAEEDRAKAEAALKEAEQMKQQAEAAAQEAAKAKAEAEAARAAALQQQQALAAEAAKAKQAADEADRLRQQAEKDKADLRARLLQQLNTILETKDSARGLISNMGDVLFETGKYELKPVARERLARVSGILLAYPSLNVAVEGYTDSTGSDDFNQKLSEQRAEAVRDYLVQAGVAEAAVTAQGFGKAQPVAPNETAEGRQKNRRVELVVSGDAIGTGTADETPAARPGSKQ